MGKRVPPLYNLDVLTGGRGAYCWSGGGGITERLAASFSPAPSQTMEASCQYGLPLGEPSDAPARALSLCISWFLLFALSTLWLPSQGLASLTGGLQLYKRPVS